MARCWCADPKERPDFIELCSIMDQFLGLISEYTELRMELVEDQFGERYYNTMTATCSLRSNTQVPLDSWPSIIILKQPWPDIAMASDEFCLNNLI